MTDSRTPHALIIGGSLGGLFAATCLRAIGWNATVFERSPGALDSRGGGLVLQPAVEEALEFAGIPLEAGFGVPSRDRIFVERDGSYRRMYMPQTQIAWNGLYQRLRNAVPPASLQSGESFVSVTQDADSVTAHFASGRQVTGDILVGADGPLSRVRELMLPDSRPRYAGYAAWRGVLAENALSRESLELLDDTFAFEDGAGHQFLTYRIPGEDGSVRVGARRQNWVWYRKLASGPALDAALLDRMGQRHSHSLPPGAMRDSESLALQQAARDLLAPSLASLIESTPEPFLQLIHDHESAHTAFGRIALIGDAAFVARPHTGAGAGKAAANALSLARSLNQAADISKALVDYELDELPADRRLVKWGISLGRRIMESPELA